MKLIVEWKSVTSPEPYLVCGFQNIGQGETENVPAKVSPDLINQHKHNRPQIEADILHFSIMNVKLLIKCIVIWIFSSQFNSTHHETDGFFFRGV